MAAAVQPKDLGTFRKYFTKPSEQVTAPDCTLKIAVYLPMYASGQNEQLKGETETESCLEGRVPPETGRPLDAGVVDQDRDGRQPL